MDYTERARELIAIDIDGLKTFHEQLGDEFARAADAVIRQLATGGKIVISGLGKSYHIGQKIAATLTSTGTPSHLMHPSEAMHGDIGMIQEKDVLIVLSFSGESEELVRLLPLVKRSGVLIVSITGRPESTVAKLSDHIIPVQIHREACPFNLAPTTSTLVTLAVGDALATLIHESRGFTREDFARLHPGGSIGNSLLKITDIMRTGDRLASVKRDEILQHAILCMTNARSGSASVVDENDVVVGIVTDGDIRRRILKGGNITELPVAEVMTPDPKRLTDDKLALDAMTFFEKYNIDDIIITDHDGRLRGMIDLQDMPKLKLI